MSHKRGSSNQAAPRFPVFVGTLLKLSKHIFNVVHIMIEIVQFTDRFILLKGTLYLTEDVLYLRELFCALFR